MTETQSRQAAFQQSFDLLMAQARAGGAGALSAARRAGFMAAGRDARRAAEAWSLVAQLDPMDAAPRVALSRLRAGAGDLEGARREALAAFADAVDEADRGFAAFALGEIAEARGDAREARDAYEAARQLADAVLTADPHDVDAAHELAEARQRLADLDLVAGDEARALAGHRAALQLLAGLAVQHPEDHAIAADRAFGHTRLADLACANGDLAAARTQIAEAETLYRRLSAAAPEDVSVQEAAAQAAALRAEIERRDGAFAAARGAMEASLAARVRLAAADPRRRGRLVDAWRRQAALLNDAGDASLAAAARAQARALAEALHAENPAADKPARDLLRILFETATSARGAGDFEAARRALADACRLADARAAAAPDDAQRRLDLAAAWDRLGELGMAIGKPASAEDAFARAAEVLRRLSSAEAPSRPLAALLLKLGGAQSAAGNHQSARASLQESVQLRLNLAQNAALDRGALRDVAVALEHLGLAAKAANDIEGAHGAWEEELMLAERVFPELDHDAVRFRARIHAHLAGLPIVEAQKHRRAALDGFDQLAAASALTDHDAHARALLWRGGLM